MIRNSASGQFSVSTAHAAPTAGSVVLGNEGKRLEAAFLVVDIRNSSSIVEANWLESSARIFKIFLNAMVAIGKANYGQIRSFNGDSILVVFPDVVPPLRPLPKGVRACNNAVTAALQMKQCALSQISPVFGFPVDFGIGIDFGEVLIVRAGLKGSDNNDLIWVGRPPNRATKLADEGHSPDHVLVSTDVYDHLQDERRLSNGRTLWKSAPFQYASQVHPAASTRWGLDFEGRLVPDEASRD